MVETSSTETHEIELTSQTLNEFVSLMLTVFQAENSPSELFGLREGEVDDAKLSNLVNDFIHLHQISLEVFEEWVNITLLSNDIIPIELVVILGCIKLKRIKASQERTHARDRKWQPDLFDQIGPNFVYEYFAKALIERGNPPRLRGSSPFNHEKLSAVLDAMQLDSSIYKH